VEKSLNPSLSFPEERDFTSVTQMEMSLRYGLNNFYGELK